MPAASQAASAADDGGRLGHRRLHQHGRGARTGLAQHARQLADRAVAEGDPDGQVRGERVDVGERHGRDSGSGADGGLRESRAARQPPSDAPSGSGSSARARSQRQIWQPSMRLKRASMAMSCKRPSTSATAGPPYCSVHTWSVGGGSKTSAGARASGRPPPGRGMRAAVGDAGEGVDRRLARVLALRPDRDLDLGAGRVPPPRPAGRRLGAGPRAGGAGGRRLRRRGRGGGLRRGSGGGARRRRIVVGSAASSSLPHPAATRARSAMRTRRRCRSALHVHCDVRRAAAGSPPRRRYVIRLSPSHLLTEGRSRAYDLLPTVDRGPPTDGATGDCEDPTRRRHSMRRRTTLAALTAAAAASPRCRRRPAPSSTSSAARSRP